ncbi:TMEM175 family protein [Nocardia stercoris]|uniref:TMEM175 family protein n=1 Tax=Nocardia stercoris TaxID=2483361 RepID=UPI001319BF9D|nr:TMEM175 family protein [Nocardia stercoris]
MSSYNEISGQSLERIRALSDGVFAVAMTLLVLDVKLPAGVGDTDAQLWHAVADLAPKFTAYLLSFTMLGLFWLAQHTLLALPIRSDRPFTLTQLGFLFVVTLLPFSAAVLAEHPHTRVAIGLYWLNLLLMGLMLAVGRTYMVKAGHVPDEQLDDATAYLDRLVLAQTLYALSAALCFADPIYSIVALLLAQSVFLVSPPRLPRFITRR